MTVPKVALNDASAMPQLGFGTFQVSEEQAGEVVGRALDIGYRHIDTAQMYGNEAGVGRALAASGIPRDELFVTTKLANDAHQPKEARRRFDASLRLLGLEYVDLFLIHWPLPHRRDGSFVETWQALMEFAADGRAKSIGVSNFHPEHLAQLMTATEVAPAVNQVEVHPYFPNEAVRSANAEHGVITQAWSPIAQGRVNDDQRVIALARDHGKTPAQITLRWHIQRGDVVFPKTTSPTRMAENLAIFDFALSAEEMRFLDQLDRGEDGRIGPHPDHFGKSE